MTVYHECPSSADDAHGFTQLRAAQGEELEHPEDLGIYICDACGLYTKVVED